MAPACHRAPGGGGGNPVGEGGCSRFAGNWSSGGQRADVRVVKGACYSAVPVSCASPALLALLFQIENSHCSPTTWL